MVVIRELLTLVSCVRWGGHLDDALVWLVEMLRLTPLPRLVCYYVGGVGVPPQSGECCRRSRIQAGRLVGLAPGELFAVFRPEVVAGITEVHDKQEA